MVKLIIVFGLGAFLMLAGTTGLAQEQYRTEISTIYERIDPREMSQQFEYLFPQQPTNSRKIGYGLSGEFFFSPVNTASHPYAEAAFLERAGSIKYKVEQVEFKTEEQEATAYEHFFLVNYAKTGFPLAIEASVDAVRLDYSDPDRKQIKSYDSSFSIGNYFTNSLLAGVDFRLYDVHQDYWNFGRLRYGLFAKYVYAFDGGGALSLEAKVGKWGLENKTGSLSLVYYWTRAFSSGIGFENTSGELTCIANGRTYTANLQYFLTPRISMTGVYNRFLYSGPEDFFYNGFEDTKSFSVTLAARF